MTANSEKPCPLQLIRLDMDAGKVEVNEDALGRLEKNLRTCGGGDCQVAVISVMGAFRTGKSFLLDLFLRYLRHVDKVTRSGDVYVHEKLPERGTGEDFGLPQWIIDQGDCIEGNTDECTGGFRFKGGMDACTEGVWIWSEPFMRTLNGKQVAVILMDTQGAWDSNMTKEQSATIFGLTAVLSSKQIYNINMQIQEDKVENLAYFMQFAQAALRKATEDMAQNSNRKSETDKPFQTLDFCVRDWRYFKDSFTVEECRKQMREHLAKHLDPTKVRENSTAEALNSMFDRMDCFCMPHPGLAIEKETWTGNVNHIDKDFIRFVHMYVREVFTEGLNTKAILGSDLSTISFPLVLRNFVVAFHDASPAAMTFTQAMTNATCLIAKEQAMKLYVKKMDEAVEGKSSGLEPKELEATQRRVSVAVEAEFLRSTIFGGDDTRQTTWESIRENLDALFVKYVEENSRRLEKALVAFAHIGILGLALFILDRISDWTCDWWSQTCAEVSKVMMVAYTCIWVYIGFHVYNLVMQRGRMEAMVAGGEFWKEMVRLLGAYGDLFRGAQWKEIPSFLLQVFTGKGAKAAKEAQDRVKADAAKKTS
eukprot:TRINITY_DN34742_c0_g1_i1.p1 TRINITY_DN34742_c0_g1~~TRINITY_DN34742_c0_g1_i1.p1  ORF type:complete len:593 (+),score=119.80 TRINITY_DN34742_c0_g1_i1:85-1863(+)